MSGGHGHGGLADGLLVGGPAATPVHRLPAHAKILGTVAFVLVVVTTPRELVPAFAGYALLLAGVAVLAAVPAPVIARRAVVELPFVGFAVLLPFLSHGDRIDVLGLQVSVTGLWGAWNVLVKATLGVVASILLAATTPVPSLVLGLERLRMPDLLVQILSFMIRYGDLVTGQMRRMSIARRARGFEGRGLRDLPAVAAGAGTLFIRSYERGERVHLAMLSRGYDGRTPPLHTPVPAGAEVWAAALVVPAAALVLHLTLALTYGAGS